MLKIFKSPKQPEIKSIYDEDGAEPTFVEEKWFDDDFAEGQLLLDVYETSKELIIKAAIAGTKAEDLNISLHNDLLTIKGKRQEEETNKKGGYVLKECYWGSFSRSLVLPCEVENKKMEAFLEAGVLTIVLKKSSKNISNIKVTAKD